MAIITATELMAQLGLTDDAPADDLGQLPAKIEAAQGHIERLLGFQIEAKFGGVDQDPVPPALKEGVLQLAAWWFENREAATDMAKALPFGVQDIVSEYREWGF